MGHACATWTKTYKTFISYIHQLVYLKKNAFHKENTILEKHCVDTVPSNAGENTVVRILVACDSTIKTHQNAHTYIRSVQTTLQVLAKFLRGAVLCIPLLFMVVLQQI